MAIQSVIPPVFTDLNTYQFSNLPVVGTTQAGQTINLGGFSGLAFEGTAANGNLQFIVNTDRGPNGEAIGSVRPFLLPSFAPELIRFELNPSDGQLSITEQIQLKVSPTQLLTGLPNTAIAGGNANTSYNDEIPIDLFGNTLPLDPLGGDVEGLVVASDKTFWLVDEYRPAIYHFDSQGVLIDQKREQGTGNREQRGNERFPILAEIPTSAVGRKPPLRKWQALVVGLNPPSGSLHRSPLPIPCSL